MNTAVEVTQTHVQKDMGALFTCKANRSPAGRMIAVRTAESPYVPKPAPFYLFDADQLKTLVIWFGGLVSRNLFIGGPAGCGKSSIVEQFANRLALPVFRVGCHRGLKMEDLRGQFTLKVRNGIQVTEFVEGPLVQAMKQGGILLLDEGDTLDPTTLLALNTIFDGAPYLIPETEELVVPHPEFRVAMTGNTMGAGDDTGFMKGTTRQNLAVMDRFLLIKADYMAWEEEALVLNAAVPKLPPKQVQGLLKLAADVRGAMKGEGDQRCEVPLSTRGLIRTATLMMFFMQKDSTFTDDAIVRCLNTGFLDRANPVDRGFVLSCAQRVGLTSQVMQ